MPYRYELEAGIEVDFMVSLPSGSRGDRKSCCIESFIIEDSTVRMIILGERHPSALRYRQ